MHHQPVYISDYGDRYDKMKWDFREDTMPIYVIGNYPYKAMNKQNANRLSQIRKSINTLCNNIEKGHGWKNNEQVKMFLEMHGENYYSPNQLPVPFYYTAINGKKTSRYLLSEMPPDETRLDGLMKPKMRYHDDNAIPIGKDGRGRALYRDMFLNLNKSESSLKNLVIHELAHSMANHIRWREDDHGKDFIECENFIKRHWT